MAIGITVSKLTPEQGTAKIVLSGLVVGTKYDVYRLHVQRRFTSAGLPFYTRILPDKKALWSAVSHRVGWTATATGHTFNDYETPITSVQYFIVESSKVGPFEFDWSGDYPLARGVLAATVVDFWWDLHGTPANRPGVVRIRSVAHAARFFDGCVVEMGDLKYTARGTELQVMGSTYPVYVADVREARRGSIVVKCADLADVEELQRIVFPANGKVWPIIFNSASEPPLILDTMVCIPLDITIEQATHSDASLRFVHIDFVEIDSTAPLLRRNANANDNYIGHPVANFSISDPTPAVGQHIVLTDTSAGQYDRWHWYTPKAREGLVSDDPGVDPPSRPASEFHTQGPQEIFYTKPGTYEIKLWIGDSTPETSAGADVIRKYVTVHR